MCIGKVLPLLCRVTFLIFTSRVTAGFTTPVRTLMVLMRKPGGRRLLDIHVFAFSVVVMTRESSTS